MKTARLIQILNYLETIYPDVDILFPLEGDIVTGGVHTVIGRAKNIEGSIAGFACVLQADQTKDAMKLRLQGYSGVDLKVGDTLKVDLSEF